MVDKDIPSVPSAPYPQLDPIYALPPAKQLCIKRLRDLFSDRPITTRRAIYNTYLSIHGPGTVSEKENWRPVLRFALPHVSYMFKSGPYRDAYVLFGIDPRKENKWAGYQTEIFNFRDKDGKAKAKEEDGQGAGDATSHLFTGREVGTKTVCYCFKDITDPMLRKILDDAVLRDRFHVCPLASVYVPFGLTGEFSGVC